MSELSGRRLNAFCQTCGDRPCPDCFPGETFNRTIGVYSDLLRRMARRCSVYRRQSRGMAWRVGYWREEAKEARWTSDHYRKLYGGLQFIYRQVCDAEDKLQAELDHAEQELATEKKRINEYVQATAKLNVKIFERADKRTAEITQLRMALQEAADSLADASRFVPAERQSHFRRQEVRAREALGGTGE